MILSGANVFAMHSLYNILNVDVDALIFSTTLIFLTLAVIIYSTIDNIVLQLRVTQLELDKLNLTYSTSDLVDSNLNRVSLYKRTNTVLSTLKQKKYKRTYSENAIEKMSNRAKSRKRDENGKFI